MPSMDSGRSSMDKPSMPGRGSPGAAWWISVPGSGGFWKAKPKPWRPTGLLQVTTGADRTIQQTVAGVSRGVCDAVRGAHGQPYFCTRTTPPAHGQPHPDQGGRARRWGDRRAGRGGRARAVTSAPGRPQTIERAIAGRGQRAWERGSCSAITSGPTCSARPWPADRAHGPA